MTLVWCPRHQGWVPVVRVDGVGRVARHSIPNLAAPGIPSTPCFDSRLRLGLGWQIRPWPPLPNPGGYHPLLFLRTPSGVNRGLT